MSKSPSGITIKPSLWAAFAAGLFVLGGSAMGLGWAINTYGLHLQKLPIYAPGDRQLSSIPRETERWRQIGTDKVESPEIIEVLGTTNYISRSYIQREPSPGKDTPVRLELHAAYYTGAIDTVPHVPERCFVGGGLQQAEFSQAVALPLDSSRWTVDETVPPELAGDSGEIYRVRLANRPEWSSSPGRRVRLPRDVTPDSPIKMRISGFETGDGKVGLFAGYFFVANGGTVANANAVRTLAFDLTSDYAYYMKVQVTSANVDSAEELAEYAADLLDGLFGELLLCTPDWIDVQEGTYPEDNPRRVAADSRADVN